MAGTGSTLQTLAGIGPSSCRVCGSGTGAAVQLGPGHPER